MDPGESKGLSSFFNRWNLGICASTAFSLSILTYIEDDLGWGLGFAIPCAAMAAGLLLFLVGTPAD